MYMGDDHWRRIDVRDKFNKVERWLIKGGVADRVMNIRSSGKHPGKLAVGFSWTVNGRERGALLGEEANNYKDALVKAYKELTRHFPELDV